MRWMFTGGLVVTAAMALAGNLSSTKDTKGHEEVAGIDTRIQAG